MNIKILAILALTTVFFETKAEKTTEPTIAVLVPGSGTYSRPISTNSDKAQKFFDQGLRFAWGFYFPESIASYQQAAIYDPDHPMPYWGMAHAMGPNPNSRYAQMPDDPKGEGLKAIKNALARIENANALESELINALWSFYNQKGTPDAQQRDRSYLAVMRNLNKKHPSDSDIAALYASSYMNIGRWDYWSRDGNPKGETLRVAQALETILAQDLTNPGVMHLHIHLLEASMEPERALVSANNLERSLPIGGHVVHMPSHIFVRTGDYKRAIENNIRSQRVDEEFAKIWGDLLIPDIGTYSLSHKIHAGHAIDFIRYAATAQGNYDAAITAALQAKTKVLADNNLRRYQKSIAAPWLIYKIFGKWNELLHNPPYKLDTPYLNGIWSYAHGSALLATGDIDAAKKQLDKLQNISNSPDIDQYPAGPTLNSSIIKIAALGLRGEILQKTGNLSAAVSAFEEAVAIEDLNSYTEPPDWVQPMRQYLGAALIEIGRHRDAERIYRRDLKWNQKNGWSLFGLNKALRAQGKFSQAEATMKLFETAWQYADLDLTRSRR